MGDGLACEPGEPVIFDLRDVGGRPQASNVARLYSSSATLPSPVQYRGDPRPAYPPSPTLATYTPNITVTPWLEYNPGARAQERLAQ